MSSIFGDGGGEGGFVDNGQPTQYDAIQNVQITAVQNSVAASTVNLNPINARLDIIEAEQIVQNTDINNLETLTTNQGNSISTLLSNVSTLTSNLNANNLRDDGQELRLNTLESTVAGLQVAGNFVTVSNFNSSQLIQDNRLTALETDMTQVNSDLITLTSVAQSHGTRLDSLENKDNLIDLQIEALDIRVTNAESTLNLKANSADVNARLSALESGSTTGVSIGTYNAKMAQLDLTNDSQDLLIASKVDQTVYNTKMAALDLTNTNQNTDIFNIITTNTNQNNRLTVLESQNKVDTSVYNAKMAQLDADQIEQNTLISGKLNTADYNADKALTDAAISFLNSSLNANDIVTTSNTSRIVVLEGRQYPQTAAQTPYTAITGIGGSLNIQTALQSLQTNIDNIVVSGSGFSSSITTLINNMSTSYLGGSLITSIPGTGANNLQAKMWSHLRDLNQNLNSDFVNGPSFRKMTIVAGNGVVNDLTTNPIFSILGNTNGNNDSRAFTVYKDGSIRSDDKLFVGGGTVEQYSLGRSGIRLSTNATFASTDGGASCSYNGAIIKLNTISQSRAENLRDLVFPSVNITGIGASADSVVMQINAPGDAEARVQMFNNGRLRLWGSTRTNGVNPSIDTTTNGDMILQGNVNASTVNANNFVGDTVNTTNLIVNGVGIDGSVNWKVGDSILIHNIVSTNLLNMNKNISIVAGGLNNFGGFLPTTVIGQNLEVRCMSKSVIIGNSNLVNSLNQNQNNAAAICIGDSHVMQNVKNGVNLINIGFSNEMNSVSSSDDSYRVCVGSGNSVRGSSSIVVGTFNNANSTNVNGAINNHNILGNNWTGNECCGSSNALIENSVYLGNALNPGDCRLTIGGGLLPIGDTVDGVYVSVFNAAFQSIRGVNNPRGTFVRIPSARKYKENIENYDFDVEDFMKLQTVKYNLKGGSGKNKMVGLIADDVDTIDSMKYLVQKNEGEVEGIDFGGFIFPLISIVKQQQKRIDSLENMIREILKLE